LTPSWLRRIVALQELIMTVPVTPKRDPRTVWTSEDPIDPVTDNNPLVGLETTVLQVWRENSPTVRAAYQADPRKVENLVRARVAAALDRELELRAEGVAQHEAEEQTRPAMWLPPTTL
jgi:hypothetical protein